MAFEDGERTMRLYASPTSPFVRKVIVTAHEGGLRDRIDVLARTISPLTMNDEVNALNPIGKIPVLATDDGQTILDSKFICEFLDSQMDADRKMLPRGRSRWNVLSLQSLGDGIMESGVLLRFDVTLKPAQYRWDGWHEAQLLKITRTIDYLETHVVDFADQVDVGVISVACALAYLDFRFHGSIEWRTGHPHLTAWFERFEQRESMVASEFRS